VKRDIDPLIDELVNENSDLTDERRSELGLALGKTGPAALEPILEALEQTDHESTRHALLDAAASLGVHDERLKSHLVELLAPHPLLAAMLLAGYDDPSTLPDLRHTLARLKAGASAPLADDAVRELEHAIDQLEFDDQDIDEGKTAQVLRREIEELERENARLREDVEQLGAPYRKGSRETVGRNDPCWCGSGRKYKRCHMRQDGA
jgi:type VI protein secretion system component VasK